MQICIILRHVLVPLLALFTIMIFYGISPVLNVFATSSPFPLQGIYNNHTDWYLEKAPGFESANPVYQPDTTESTQSIASWFHRDAFSSTDIGSTWYYGGNNIQNNIVPVAFNDLITVSQIEDVFRQIIIETAIKGS